MPELIDKAVLDCNAVGVKLTGSYLNDIIKCVVYDIIHDISVIIYPYCKLISAGVITMYSYFDTSMENWLGIVLLQFPAIFLSYLSGVRTVFAICWKYGKYYKSLLNYRYFPPFFCRSLWWRRAFIMLCEKTEKILQRIMLDFFSPANFFCPVVCISVVCLLYHYNLHICDFIMMIYIFSSILIISLSVISMTVIND
ncbi:hypothetical protein ACF0H5_023968 [Mactra antiquata]